MDPGLHTGWQKIFLYERKVTSYYLNGSQINRSSLTFLLNRERVYAQEKYWPAESKVLR